MCGIRKKLNFYYLSLLLDIRSVLGKSPFLFRIVQKLSPTRRSETLVERCTGLCIEAPSGSASSYFVRGFEMINPDVRLAHHHHVAAQVLRSCHLRVPTVVILRDPIDCVVSRAAFWNTPILIGAIFRQWIRFFREIEKVRDDVLFVSFESVTRKPEVVIKAINAHFNTDFNSQLPEVEQVFSGMDRVYTGPEQQNPNRPSMDKESVKKSIRPSVVAHKLAQPACELYSRLVDTAV
jgi:hypothetical protein